MPDSRRSGSATCLHDLEGSRDAEDIDSDFEESDPSSRYVRYREVLGRGAFKTVYRAFDEVDGIEVAWNQIKVQDVLRTPEDLERLYSEVHLLKTLKHKNIIKFYHSWVDTDTKNINFITEIFTSGTLRQYRKRHKHVDIKAVKNWSRQILRGLLYLHSHDPPIIHRDLKCDNIFINGNQGEVKIGDLGLAAILRQAHAAHSVIGTPEFMAPELYEEEYTELVDIYSFGMCLLEMVTFEYPYSECTNAAQIYKKVTSGKKPAALDKIKDPGLREFVEKCLATASKRLPARELLMDPFLQCDGDRDPTECMAISAKTCTSLDDMNDLGGTLGKTFCKPTIVCRNFADRDSSSSLAELCQAPLLHASSDSRFITVDELSALKSPCKMLPHTKEDKIGRNMDFKVKGKRRENDTVYLRLRIADTEGQIRIIHFPFDVEGDTAMSVASEMVAELDLADQDVTKIAEMIDAAILVMVPEWKPGVAIDEACGEGEHDSSKTPVHNDHPSMHWSSDHLSTMSSGSSFIDQSQHGSLPWQASAGATPVGTTLPPQTEGTMHGRFEEVMYHHRRPERSGYVEDVQCTISSYSSEGLGEWEPTDESSSPVSPVSSAPKNRSGEVHSLPATASEGAMAAFNEIVECRGLTSCIGERWDAYGVRNVDDCVEKRNSAELFQKDPYDQYAGNILLPAFPAVGFDDDGNSELVSQEIRELSLRYERELRELQRKHEAALLDLRDRWRLRRAAAARMQQHGSILRNDEAKQESRPDSFIEQMLDRQVEAGHHIFSNQVVRNRSTNDIRSTSQSGRLSLSELTCLLAQINNPDDPRLSMNSGANTGGLCVEENGFPNSSKMVSKPSVPTFARGIMPVNGSDSNPLYKVGVEESSCHKVATFSGQNLLDSNAGVLFLPIQSEKLEPVHI